jgi:hypothetical protein
VEAGEPVELMWNFHTRARIEPDGDRAVLSLGSSRMEARILAPEGARFEVASVHLPPPQKPLRDVRNLIIRLPRTRGDRLAVLFTPARDDAAPEPEPLARWIELGRLEPEPASASPR